MKHVQEGIFEDKDMSSVATKPRKVNGRKKTVKFSHITLVDGGTQAIPQYGMPDKTYENLYNLAFADSIIGIPQTFDCEDEKFTLLIHSKDQKHINISICNTKDFDEQLVRAVDKNSQKPVSSNLELKYYTFASINRKNNCIAYLFNKNI
ncbi:MAG: hypothetical protein J1G02_06250, partial [Clostridiales bacterium]|nr:hypothetical protein [Clostridiales bacterium]